MKRRRRTLLLQLLLQLLTSTLSPVTVVQCFNLDVRIPVIKTGGAHAESFFGYAVAQHRTAAASARGEAMVLVGAPQDENLQPGTTRSGALWKCAWNNDIQVSQVEMQYRSNGASILFYICTSNHDSRARRGYKALHQVTMRRGHSLRLSSALNLNIIGGGLGFPVLPRKCTVRLSHLSRSPFKPKLTIAHFPDVPGRLHRHTNNVLNRRHTQKSGAATVGARLGPVRLRTLRRRLVLLPDSVCL